MKLFFVLFIGLTASIHNSGKFSPSAGMKDDRSAENADSLPAILPDYHADLIYSRLREEAVLKFAEHQLPANLKEWEPYRSGIKDEIINKAGIYIDHKLPLDMHKRPAQYK